MTLKTVRPLEPAIKVARFGVRSVDKHGASLTRSGCHHVRARQRLETRLSGGKL
jgi:hypothetical protein